VAPPIQQLIGQPVRSPRCAVIAQAPAGFLAQAGAAGVEVVAGPFEPGRASSGAAQIRRSAVGSVKGIVAERSSRLRGWRYCRPTAQVLGEGLKLRAHAQAWASQQQGNERSPRNCLKHIVHQPLQRGRRSGASNAVCNPAVAAAQTAVCRPVEAGPRRRRARLRGPALVVETGT